MKRIAFLSIVSAFMIIAPVALPSTAMARTVCQSMASQAACEFGTLRVQNNAWSGDHGPQRLMAWSPQRWQVLTRQPNIGGAVQTYPDTEVPYYRTHEVPYSKLSMLRFGYSERMPKSGYDAEATADIWLNNWDVEVMAWVDNHGQTPFGSPVATYHVYGSTWTLWRGDSRHFAFVQSGRHPHGTVHVLSLLRILVHRHDLLIRSVTSLQFGFEVCWTHGFKIFNMFKFREWTKT